MIVLKFGGTSVSGKQQILTICNIVSQQRKENPLVVVSALSSITDILTSLTENSSTKKEHLLKTITDYHIELIDELWKSSHQKKIHKQYIDTVVNNIKTNTEKKVRLTGEEKDFILSQGELMSS